MKEFERWIQKGIKLDDDIEDAFYKELEFGTAGLRGVIGMGTNRMNIYTVGKVSQGLSNYLNNKYDNPSIAISYDSRIMSYEFAEISARIFNKNNIKVYIYKELMPTPCLSYAVRYLKCSAGIMITASHNPSKYNGYKVYNNQGCQINETDAKEIESMISKIDIFDDVKIGDFNVNYIEDVVTDNFLSEIKKTYKSNDKIDKSFPIVYTPLNGTGLKPVTRILKETGFNNVILVKEQEKPDGNFPTCSYPNPELPKTMELGIKYAIDNNADLVLATDPDCDRVGVAVKEKQGKYILLTGNEIGVLLLDFICSNTTLPKDPVFVKTIVTTDLAQKVADNYNVKTINVLTGFKYIGEQIDLHEKQYIFGYEESNGYLSGTHVRDKDGVNGVYIIAEMFAFYKTKGISLFEKLNELYNKYGYTLNTMHSFEFAGQSGFIKMQNIMNDFKTLSGKIGPYDIVKVLDFNKSIDGLPKSNVLKFVLSGNDSFIVRPSGTEPKLKIYLTLCAETKEKTKEKELVLLEILNKMLV